MQVSLINQNPIVNLKLSGFFNMQRALFIVDMLEDVVHIVVHCSHSVKLFFCGGGGEFVVVMKVYGMWITAIETSVGGEFVGSSGCGIVGKSCKR